MSTPRLFLLSAGPGDTDLLTPAARHALAASTDLVAYGRYLRLLGELGHDKRWHELPLGQECQRARLALDLAAAGHPTALISSGDIGIYAMAAVVFELLDHSHNPTDFNPAWQDVELEVLAGLSAMQVAASRSGAILGHDFCAISLSDLLTPWEVIAKRIQSAAQGDFVVCFYNPASQQRQWQLPAAQQLLLQHRPPSTPVVLARNLTRAAETVRIIDLEQLATAQVDMLTVVCVGNRATRRLVHGREWVYTPRGYFGEHQ